jgi:hypothetical protein
MSQVKYGQLQSWSDGDVSTPNDFMNLQEGDNIVRVFTNPYQFHVAWVKDTSGANRKIRSALENCPLVKAGHKIQPRWYIGVLDRKSGQPKILEISTQVYLGIKNYFSDPNWGDVTQYDLNVKRGPKGSQPLYTVIGYPPKTLNAEDVALIERFKGRVNIEKFTVPPTPEEVAEKLGVVFGGVTPTVAVGTQHVTPSSAPAAGVQPTVSDEDFNFGDEEL